LLIVDEVQSGVGRTGKWWAVEHEEVEPDIVCFAKGIASGLPLGGIIARKEVMDWKPGAHGSTFGGNPIAVAAAVATLTTIEQEGLLNQAAQTGQFIQDALVEMESRHPSIGEVRGRGLMIGAEFVKSRETKERAVELRNHVIHSAFQKGLLLLPCGTNTIRFIPPLNIERNLVEEGLHILETAVTEAEARYL
jgi:4-aminobutyrate aminotransferase